MTKRLGLEGQALHQAQACRDLAASLTQQMTGLSPLSKALKQKLMLKRKHEMSSSKLLVRLVNENQRLKDRLAIRGKIV